MRRIGPLAGTLVGSALLAAALPARAAGPPFDVGRLRDRRAVAIVQPERVEPGDERRRGLARAVLEQANLAFILRLQSAPLASVEAATADMASGERLPIAAVGRVSLLDCARETEGPYDDRLADCAPRRLGGGQGRDRPDRDGAARAVA